MDQLDLLKGMYVRCPYEFECKEDPRVFIIGQISQYMEIIDEVIINIHDLENMRVYMPNLPHQACYRVNQVERCTIFEGSLVNYRDKINIYKEGVILQAVKEEDDPYYYYYVQNSLDSNQVVKLREDCIVASFDCGKVNPIDQMRRLELQNPRWYNARNKVINFTSVMENAPRGFDLLVGARAYLFTHQIDTIMRATQEDTCRLMLADEVGLGKTIEALIIARTLQDKQEDFKTLVLVPSTLMNQWKNEFEIKLWQEATIYKTGIPLGNTVIADIEQLGKENVFTQQKWDLVIVDEVHKILSRKNIYEAIYKLSCQVSHVLILSATPITTRRTEYLKLLRLLNPSKYVFMTESNFEKLVDKNSKIKEHVCMIRDHLEEYQTTSDIGCLEDILDELEYIDEYTEDELIQKSINKIDLDHEAEAVTIIEQILWYISEYYQIDRNIIKHRRQELKTYFATRKVETLVYTMQDGYTDYYEYEAYVALLDFLPAIEDWVLKKKILNSFFSSPQACLNNLQQVDHVYHSEIYHYLVAQIRKFKEAVQKDCYKIKEIIQSAELNYTRYTSIIDYIDQEVYDKKVIVFSSYTETAELMTEMLKNYYEDNRITCFYKGMHEEELIENMDRFQNDDKATILVCDYLAGEGRNLQYADLIIHVDLPISPTDLEQRIGRLDRIGRAPDHDILSVVVYAANTIEEDLYHLWDKCLNIFQESVSGLEIALNEIEQTVSNYITNYEYIQLEEVIVDLQEKVEKLKRQLREEHSYDASRQLSRYLHTIISKLIEKVDENEGEQLAKAMMSWAGMVGLQRDTSEQIRGVSMAKFTRQSFSQGSFLQAWYFPPYTGEILKRAPRKHALIGTFSRAHAISHEDIAFFAPGEPIFDSLLEHARKNYRGTCCGVQCDGPVDFEGFLINWKVAYNIDPVLKGGGSLREIDQVKVYQTNFIVKDIVRIDGDEHLTVEELDKYIQIGKIRHIGSRKGTTKSIEEMIYRYGSIERWQKIVNAAKKQSFKHIKEYIENRLGRVYRNFTKGYQLNQSGIAKGCSYYENEVHVNIDAKQKYKLLAQGIKESKIEVDSIVYVRMNAYDTI